MPVALLPPLTISCAQWDGKTVPIYEAPRYVRGPGNSRWHRPRCGNRRSARYATLTFWCGSGYVRLDDCLGADSVPEPEPVCGTCEGRALGAGQDDTPAGVPRLAFEPRWLVPPRRCPGSGRCGIFECLGQSAGRCLVCGDLVGLRAGGGPYNGWYGPVVHMPGPGLFPPCPWHAWNLPSKRAGGSVGCRCGWPGGD